MDEQANQQDSIRREAEAALEYRRAIMKIRLWSAWLGGIGVYMILDALGIVPISDLPILIPRIVLIAAGAVVAITAIAAAVKPCAGTMVMQSIGFGIIGACGFTFAVLAPRGAAAGGATVGVLSTVLAVSRFVKLPGFVRIAAQRPSDEVMQRLAAVANGIRKTKVKDDPDLLEFKVGNARWRAKLADTVVTFVEAQKGADMLFVPRAEFRLEDRTAPGKDPKKRKVTIHASDREWKTKLPREDFQRLREWESAGQQAVPAEGA